MFPNNFHFWSKITSEIIGVQDLYFILAEETSYFTSLYFHPPPIPSIHLQHKGVLYMKVRLLYPKFWADCSDLSFPTVAERQECHYTCYNLLFYPTYPIEISAEIMLTTSCQNWCVPGKAVPQPWRSWWLGMLYREPQHLQTWAPPRL